MKTAQAELDAAVVPKAILSALEKVAVAIVGAREGPEPERRFAPAPYLFKIIVNGDLIILKGDDDVGTIEVDLPKED